MSATLSVQDLPATLPLLVVPPEVRRLISEGALFVANHSGGKDSQACLIRLLEIIPRKQLLVIHASLGEVEWEGALELAEKQAADCGLPFIVAKAARGLFEMIERRYEINPGPNSSCFPSPRVRYCTSDAKRGPIEREVRRYAKAHGFTRIVSCLGIRAEESPGRAKRAPLSVNKRGTIASREWWEWNPIHDHSVADVFNAIAGAGQSPHWAYAAGNTRLSCVFCFMSNPRDIANGAKHRPELLAKYVELEERTGYMMHASRVPLPEIVAKGLSQLSTCTTSATSCA